MARTDVVTRVITRTGSTPALTAPVADGDIVDVGAQLNVVTGATGTTVTIQVPVTVDGLTVTAPTVVIPANQRREISLASAMFRQPSSALVGAGRVLVDYSSVATVTREATETA